MTERQPNGPTGETPRESSTSRIVTPSASAVHQEADELTQFPAKVHRLPYLVYLAGIAVVVTAFLLEISRGQCPVP